MTTMHIVCMIFSLRYYSVLLASSESFYNRLSLRRAAGVIGGTGGEASGSLPSLHRAGVALLAFSQDGHWLASMGHEPEHTVAVYK